MCWGIDRERNLSHELLLDGTAGYGSEYFTIHRYTAQQTGANHRIRSRQNRPSQPWCSVGH